MFRTQIGGRGKKCNNIQCRSLSIVMVKCSVRRPHFGHKSQGTRVSSDPGPKQLYFAMPRPHFGELPSVEGRIPHNPLLRHSNMLHRMRKGYMSRFRDPPTTE